MSTNRLYVCGTGMLTAIGGDSLMTFNAVKAGISQFQSSGFCNRAFDAMTSAPVPEEAFQYPDPPDDTPLAKQNRYRRMLGIATVGLAEVLSARNNDEPIALFLAGPESAPTNIPSMDGKFLAYLNEATDSKLDLAQSRLLCSGKAGGLECLELAFRYMEQTGAKEVLIGGVDSLLDLFALGFYDTSHRIAAVNIKDGFCPSEGAGFLWLCNEAIAAGKKVKPLGYVNKPGLSKEPGHRYSGEPYRGDGLAQAVTIALQQNLGLMVRTIFASLNGESFTAKEHGVAILRNNKRIADAVDIEHPIDCFGDPGAATACLLIGLALMGMSKNIYSGPGLVYASSDADLRAACCVSPIH